MLKGSQACLYNWSSAASSLPPSRHMCASRQQNSQHQEDVKDECSDMQIGTILCWLHIWSNCGVKWLPWPSRIRRRYFPVMQPFVVAMKIFWRQKRPIWSVTHPFSLSSILQSCGRASSPYQAYIWGFPLNTMHGGRAHPIALTHPIAIGQENQQFQH